MAASDKSRPDTGMRVGRQLFSTSFLQAQIASCCCTQAGAELQITATLLPIVDPASGRAVLLLTMYITNNGPSMAEGVNVTAYVPALATSPPSVRVTPTTPLILSGSQLQAYLGSMLNGESRSLRCILLPLSIRSSPVAGFKFVIGVRGSVSEINFDPIPQNNTFSASADAPFPARVTGFTGGGAMPVNNIVVTFSKRMQPSSINKNTFLIENAQTGAPVTADSIQYDDSTQSTTLSITGNGFLVGAYVARLIGTGAAPILDDDGLALDGDSNGLPGGDYSKHFGVG